jgi:ribosome assembly protein YihI (activator of Der GTPase)
LEDGYAFGVLSSRIHVMWSLASGGRLEDRPRYQNFACFDPFPFPSCSDAQKSRIRDLAEQLDAHRKRQQTLHPKLTLTDMYNVLEKLRAGEELSAKERTIHEQGLVSVLRQIHDDLDAAVFEAYGWPATLTDDEILHRLVALNAQRAAEEAAGLVRWLRPEFQNPAAAEQQKTLGLLDEGADEGKKEKKRKGKAKAAEAGGKAEGAVKPAPSKAAWPKGRAAQAKAVLAALREAAAPLTGEELAARFTRAPREVVDELLQALVALGQARRTRAGKYQ